MAKGSLAGKEQRSRSNTSLVSEGEEGRTTPTSLNQLRRHSGGIELHAKTVNCEVHRPSSGFTCGHDNYVGCRVSERDPLRFRLRGGSDVGDPVFSLAESWV